MDFTRIWRAESCRQVYLPCWSASGQLERIWWMVGCVWPQRGQVESILGLHRFKFNGVGRVSEPALRRKDIWPAGRPSMILLQTWFELSSSATSRIFLWTVSSFSLLSCFSVIWSLNSLLQLLFRVLLEIVVIDDLALCSRSTVDGWILWFLQYSSSVRIDRISSMTGSCESSPTLGCVSAFKPSQLAAGIPIHGSVSPTLVEYEWVEPLIIQLMMYGYLDVKGQISQGSIVGFHYHW